MKKLKKLCSLFLTLALILTLMPVSVLSVKAEEEPERWWESKGDGGIATDQNLPGRAEEREGWMQSYYFANQPVYLLEYRGTGVVSGQTFQVPSRTVHGDVVSISGAMYQRPVFREADRPNLTSVQLPNNGRFSTIGNDAFRDCVNLTEVLIPDTTKTICLRSFQGCASLENLVIPESVTSIGKDAFKDTAPGFTIYGVPGSVAHIYADYYQIPFVSSTTEHLSLDVPEMTWKQNISISGYTNASQVQILLNDELLYDALAVDDNFKYTAEVSLPAEGDYTITAVAVYGGRQVTVSKNVSYDEDRPKLLMFQGYSQAHNCTGPVDLLPPGLIYPILWHQSGRPYTFEIKLSESPEVSKVYVVSERNGEQKMMAANWDANKGMWIASGFFDPDDLSYVPGELSVWCEWKGNAANTDLLEGIGSPDRDSTILLGVGAQAFVPGNNSANGKYQKVNPNSGKNNLAPGLSVITNKGSEQWVLVVEEEAVGKEFVFWAQSSGIGEYIFVTFNSPGNYDIGNIKGMQHLALVKCSDTSMDSGIVGKGKCNIIIDPSGYVYEAVPSNRLADVKTTIYYMGDEDGNLIDRYTEVPAGKAFPWNAEDYEQENPLYTNNDGVFAWDVPDGWWQVKYELDGYETQYTEWMPVPPEQTEVNIGMVSKAAPTVTQVNGYPEGIEIIFSKYMKLDTLKPENFTVRQSGTGEVPGKIMVVNAEYNYDESAQYASIVRFVPEQELSGEIQLTVHKDVKSYAGTEMAQTDTKTISIRPEPKSIIAKNLHLSYDGVANMTVRVEPAEAAAGMTLKASSAQPYVASITNTEVVVDENGEAVFQVTGNLPGTAQITLALTDTLLMAQEEVSVGLPNQFEYEVENITVMGENARQSILTPDGTLRMTAAVLPINATNRAVTWSVEEGTGKAIIDNTGLLTAVSDGTVTVKAAANDGSGVYGTAQVDITGQSPVITGPETMSLVEGYQDVSTDAYKIIGKAPMTIKVITGNEKIIWNDATQKLHITAGLTEGRYPVTITASNGNQQNATFTFTLAVTAAPIVEDDPVIDDPIIEKPAVEKPIIKGSTTMQLTEGYTAVSTSAYTITGTAPIVVTKTSGHNKIKWNNKTKKLDIAAGLKAGSYPVKLKAGSQAGESSLTFTLKVVKKTAAITSVTVSPRTAKAVKGKTKQFKAKVAGRNSYAKTVIWKVSGNKKKGTKISKTGKLTVAANETARKLTVTAYSKQNKAKYGKATVTVVKPTTPKPDKKVAPTSRTLEKGKTITLKAPKSTTLYYTLNGKKPTMKSAKVKPGKSKKITVNKKTTLKVFAVKKNCQQSSVVTRVYKVK